LASTRGILSLSRELGAREARAEHYTQHEVSNAEPWELKEGIHNLSPDEETKAKALHDAYKDFMFFYSSKKIYFSEEVCNLIESFAIRAGYMGVMYQNVTIRDDEDQPYVNSLVLKTWDERANRFRSC
jgi:hypothetical protein